MNGKTSPADRPDAAVTAVDDEVVADRIFQALAHRTRRRILDLLRDHPRTTGDVCFHFPELDRCTTMQHLRVLERAGLVIPIRRGRERWNHLDVLPFKQISDRWIGDMASSAVGLLAELDSTPD